jgi:hypothetical protein
MLEFSFIGDLREDQEGEIKDYPRGVPLHLY